MRLQTAHKRANRRRWLLDMYASKIYPYLTRREVRKQMRKDMDETRRLLATRDDDIPF